MISIRLVEELQYFVGKVCTVLTNPIGMSLNEQTFSKWFTIRVESIDQEAVIGSDVQRGTKQVYFFPLQGLLEEQTIYPDNPEYEKLKEQFSVPVPTTQKPRSQLNVLEPSTGNIPSTLMGCSTPAKATDNIISMESLIQQASALKEKYGDKQ